MNAGVRLKSFSSDRFGLNQDRRAGKRYCSLIVGRRHQLLQPRGNYCSRIRRFRFRVFAVLSAASASFRKSTTGVAIRRFASLVAPISGLVPIPVLCAARSLLIAVQIVGSLWIMRLSPDWSEGR